MRDKILKHRYDMLNLRSHPLFFHQAQLTKDILEYQEATTFITCLSQASDVIFTTSRARYEGSSVSNLPTLISNNANNAVIYAYMMAKFTSRWAFYLAASRLSGEREVREVVNPRKDENLVAVARRHGLDHIRFSRVARILRCVWPLLP